MLRSGRKNRQKVAFKDELNQGIHLIHTIYRVTKMSNLYRKYSLLSTLKKSVHSELTLSINANYKIIHVFRYLKYYYVFAITIHLFFFVPNNILIICYIHLLL